jgi:hypothetical protein
MRLADGVPTMISACGVTHFPVERCWTVKNDPGSLLYRGRLAEQGGAVQDLLTEEDYAIQRYYRERGLSS